MTRSPQPIRRSNAWICTLLCVLMLCAASQSASAKNPRDDKKQDYKRQVEQLEERWRRAQLAGDVAEMDKLLSDDYIGITMSGQVVTKLQQLDRMRTRQLELTKILLSDVKVKLIGPAAIVTSEAEVDGTNDGASVHGTYRYTRVYTRLASGQWKITNFEATRVGPPREQRVRNEAPPPAGASTSH